MKSATLIVLLMANMVVWPPAALTQSENTQQKQAQGAPGGVSVTTLQTPQERAWRTLEQGVQHNSLEHRSKAVEALGLLPSHRRATILAEAALKDEKLAVRVAAATALGQMSARGSISKLRTALSDPEPEVALAAAHSLDLMKDKSAYGVYYEVLTGQRKSSRSTVSSQLEQFKNPRKLARLGLQQGIGFVPFGGIGFSAFRVLSKDDSSPVRAACAQVLAKDPDPASGEALLNAAFDKNSEVRIAALEALAKRGDRSVISQIEPVISDEKDPVRYSAAAAILRLSAVPDTTRAPRRQKRKTAVN